MPYSRFYLTDLQIHTPADSQQGYGDWGGKGPNPAFAKKLLGPFEYPGVVKLGDSAVVLRVLVKTQAHDGAAVLRELRRRVKKAFDTAGIEIPFPHVKLVRDREGAA